MDNQPTTTSVDNPYGLAALWAGGDLVARAVLIILAIMSLSSWYVILTKLWDQRKLKQQARVVEKQFWTAPSLKDGVERLKKGDEFRAIAEDGLRAASHHDGRLTDRIDLHEWITMSLQRAVDAVRQAAVMMRCRTQAVFGDGTEVVALLQTLHTILQGGRGPELLLHDAG